MLGVKLVGLFEFWVLLENEKSVTEVKSLFGNDFLRDILKRLELRKRGCELAFSCWLNASLFGGKEECRRT